MMLSFLNLAIGACLIGATFPGIVAMGLRTNHPVRIVYLIICIGGAAMILSMFEGTEWMHRAHIAVIAGFALLALVGRRPADRLKRPAT